MSLNLSFTNSTPVIVTLVSDTGVSVNIQPGATAPFTATTSATVSVQLNSSGPLLDMALPVLYTDTTMYYPNYTSPVLLATVVGADVTLYSQS